MEHEEVIAADSSGGLYVRPENDKLRIGVGHFGSVYSVSLDPLEAMKVVLALVEWALHEQSEREASNG